MPRQIHRNTFKEVARETVLEAGRIGLTALLCTGGMVLGSFALCSQIKKPENMLDAWYIGGFTGAFAGYTTARLLRVTPNNINTPFVAGLSSFMAAGAKELFKDRIEDVFYANLQR